MPSLHRLVYRRLLQRCVLQCQLCENDHAYIVTDLRRYARTHCCIPGHECSTNTPSSRYVHTSPVAWQAINKTQSRPQLLVNQHSPALPATLQPAVQQLFVDEHREYHIPDRHDPQQPSTVQIARMFYRYAVRCLLLDVSYTHVHTVPPARTASAWTLHCAPCAT